MKKMLFFAAIALAALGSCTNDEFVGENQNSNSQDSGAINFGSGLKAITRTTKTGKDAATLLNNNFVVEGVKWDGGSDAKVTVFDNYNVNYAENSANTTTSNSDGWEYVAQTKHANATIDVQTIKYWDYGKKQYDFIAYSLGTATFSNESTVPSGSLKASSIDVSKMNGIVTNDIITDGAYTIEGAADDLKKAYIADMVTVYRDGASENDAAGNYNQTVQFSFRSLAAKVRVGLYEIVPGYSVKDVVFYTDGSTKDDGENKQAHLYTSGSTDKFYVNGKYIVYFPTTGSTNNGTNTDYNKAHVQFVAAESGGSASVMNLGALDGTNTYVVRETAETTSATDKLYIGRTSDNASYAGSNDANHYSVVLPNEGGAVLNLKVDYTLVSIDGSGETINVTGATAQVPAIYAAWKSGYAYTYLFKISQNSNGVTNPSAGPAGLYPITFDAVVTESEDGVQETITTVSEPSITTYSKGAIVTGNDEYITGSNIYVVVDNGTALTVGTNAKLYTVTLTNTKTSSDDGYHANAAQTINEASVANVLKTTESSGSWTVTDINNWQMTVATASGMTAVTEIAATDAPDGNSITINGAKFTPSTAGTYVFEYTKSVTSYVAATGTYVNGTTYYTDATGETEVDATSFVEGTTDVSTYYVSQTSASGDKIYKIIKVVAAPSSGD